MASLGDEKGNRMPTQVASRTKMLPDLPAAKKAVLKAGAQDLLEMIFGEDAHGSHSS